MLLMLYGTMCCLWADRRHYYRQRNRLASYAGGLRGYNAGRALSSAWFNRPGWPARRRAAPAAARQVCAQRTPISRTPMRSARCRRGHPKPDVHVVDSVPSGSPPVGTCGVWPPPYFIIITALQVATRPTNCASCWAASTGTCATRSRAGADHYRHAGRRPWARALHRRHRPVHLCRLAGGRAPGCLWCTT